MNSELLIYAFIVGLLALYLSLLYMRDKYDPDEDRRRYYSLDCMDGNHRSCEHDGGCEDCVCHAQPAEPDTTCNG